MKKYRILKAENPKIDAKSTVSYSFDDKRAGDVVKFFGVDMTIVQNGDVVVLSGKDSHGNNILYVLQREYEDESYITDYKKIREPEDLIVNEAEKVFVVKSPMSMEALWKYIRFHAPLKEPAINIVGNNTYEFVNGWRLYGSESHMNIKDGRYSYESRVVKC